MASLGVAALLSSMPTAAPRRGVPREPAEVHPGLSEGVRQPWHPAGTP